MSSKSKTKQDKNFNILLMLALLFYKSSYSTNDYNSNYVFWKYMKRSSLYKRIATDNTPNIAIEEKYQIYVHFLRE